jgi:DNA polymerase-1
MLLTQEEFFNVVKEVQALECGGIAYDYETTGFSTKRGAKAFLLGFAHDRLGTHTVLLESMPPKAMADFLGNPRLRYAAHNIKFEMSFDRDQFDATIAGKPWCTMVMDRVVYNNHRSYSLENCATRRGWVAKYLPFIKWKEAHPDDSYDKAPLDLLVPYCEQDARLSLGLMNEQIETFKQWDHCSPHPIRAIIDLEIKTTRHLFEMENHGLTVNKTYCQEALAYENLRLQTARAEFGSLAGEELTDSGKCLEPIFKRMGLPYGLTEKGHPSFDYESLRPSLESPLVKALLKHRDAQKRASSFWENFLSSEINGRIYPDIKQAGAATFRMSIVNPACQTWPDDSEPDRYTGWVNPYPIRRAFTASDEDHVIVSMDWAQMELRKMADEAGEMKMIRDIQNGTDFHQETADLGRVPRSIAKNGRFAKLYGAGINRLAKTLGVDYATAKRVANAIDDTSPRITTYTQELIRYARQNPYGINWLGRRYFFDPGFEYKYPNYRIQGGCTEILRIALDRICGLLPARSRVLLPYHDEFIFDLHRDDLSLLPEIKRIMVASHRDKRFLEMDVSCAVGPNFHDLEEHTICA